ncbi:excinuclease ABC subunit UvrA [Modestobacter italicus]|uniref:excinuclease ABC subunit UvrA n=1 Tax=Modestobacter italicus (strain DSM 44449 / CECT 9708 / BC 501) TaxID=2732864 RepID=UPI001C950C76|nr:excinuclease ABC subunit UvrA [Modestobacter italicus]
MIDEQADACVRVRGAREHNLRNVDVDVPRDSLVVFTGVSGSGKSSLAFGTIYAEAQRRYFESVAPYARRLIQQVGAPVVDEIAGLPPAVALQQSRGVPSSRSTVGTVTTLSNSLRMLLSRAGSYPPGAERLDSDAFSPNTAAGACPECSGLGRVHVVTEDTLVPDPSLSIRDGAIAAWPGAWYGKSLRDILIELGHDVDRPWRDIPQAERDWILFTDEQPEVTVHPVRGVDQVQRDYQGRYTGARAYVLHTLANTKSPTMRQRALRFVRTSPCPVCGGRRLRPESLAVTFAGRTIAELAAQPLTDLAATLRGAEEAGEVAVRITTDLVARIEVLTRLGLGYLSLDRTTPTLSPGELQRLRIATQLRSGLFGVVYVLDEPSAGLHPADAEPLLDVLDQLVAAGNSLFVIEHDMALARRADWIVDVGPYAGERGGRVLYSGPVAGLAEVEDSVTRPYLLDTERPAVRPRRRPTGRINLLGVERHNLRGVDAAFPLGVFTAVTGVSGSGKSTLVSQALADVVAQHVGPQPDPESDDDAPDDDAVAPVRVEGLDAVDRLVRVDQKPIGRTPRSNLATYTGLFDDVRKVFAATDEARARGYSAGRFSFNVAEGRCPTCQGEGVVAVELLFLPGTSAPCPTCAGARYNAETLEVTHRGRNIAEVLDLTVEAAIDVLADLPSVATSLRTLQEVGLGYLRLGQPATELSGGEAQRVKLASELQRARRGHTLYLLDEPTTGLHPADVALLMRQLHQLVDAGNTVVVVEHDMDVVAGADWVLDLGPGAGDDGGRIVAAGTPEEVAAVPESRTARFLAPRLPA